VRNHPRPQFIGRRAAVAALLGWLAIGASTAAAPPSPNGPTGGTYHGTEGQLDIAPPRLEESVTIDGVLDEPAWQRAALLTGFSRYSPVDGAPADRRTDVLVWYSPTALHVGVRAEAEPSAIRATLADRDRLDTDDQVTLFLGTFNDGRQALVFIVNPLGVQADGALVEGTRTQTGGFDGLTSGREAPDLSQDFVFASRGRLTATGFEVEVRIPFKRLRYQASDPQDWGFNVTRTTERPRGARTAGRPRGATGRRFSHSRVASAGSPACAAASCSTSTPPSPRVRTASGRVRAGATTPRAQRRGSTCAGASPRP
jgi:hypothetical protein